MDDWKLPERPLEPPEDPPRRTCPVCGEECETLYRRPYGEILGCENCVETEVIVCD